MSGKRRPSSAPGTRARRKPQPAPAPPEIETVQGRIGSALGTQVSRVQVRKMRRGYQLTLHVTDDARLNASSAA